MLDQLHYFEQIKDVMIRSGQLVMQRFNINFDIIHKAGGSIVTAVDIENEQFLKQELAKIVPQASFLAEESGISGEQSEYIWVIDALDGTRNFVKGLPHFCIMIALTYKNEPIVAAIYYPVTKQLCYAEKGKGLWLDGRQIKFFDRLELHKTALVVCNQIDIKSIKLKLKDKNIQISRRYFGSIGVDILYLIAGNIDLIDAQNISWWDIAPGILIVAEAQLTCMYEKSLLGNDFYTFKAGNKLFF